MWVQTNGEKSEKYNTHYLKNSSSPLSRLLASHPHTPKQTLPKHLPSKKKTHAQEIPSIRLIPPYRNAT
jgi:hypothetical protein